MDTAKVLALMWQMINDKNLSNKEKYALLLNFDKIFGLNLAKIKRLKIPQKIKKLINLREKYCQANDWEKADEVRKIIQSKGYKIEDALEKPKIKNYFKIKIKSIFLKKNFKKMPFL